MKREDITKLFPEATKEQIDALMAVNGEDINKAKGDTAQLQKDLDKARADLAEKRRPGRTQKGQRRSRAVQERARRYEAGRFAP